MERHHQHCIDHHHRRALGPWFHHRVTLPLVNPWTATCGSWVFFYPRRTRRTRKKILVKDYSRIFVKMSSRRRSKIKPFPEARYSSAFSVEIFVKDYIFSCLSARNLWRKSLIKIWPMARNQSSEFRRNLYGWFGLRERKMFWSSEDRVRDAAFTMLSHDKTNHR